MTQTREATHTPEPRCKITAARWPEDTGVVLTGEHTMTLDGVSFHRHANGGGWVANTAHVADTAFVGLFAWVYDKAQVYDKARVCDKALVCGDAQVYGEARVCGKQKISG